MAASTGRHRTVWWKRCTADDSYEVGQPGALLVRPMTSAHMKVASASVARRPATTSQFRDPQRQALGTPADMATFCVPEGELAHTPYVSLNSVGSASHLAIEEFGDRHAT